MDGVPSNEAAKREAQAKTQQKVQLPTSRGAGLGATLRNRREPGERSNLPKPVGPKGGLPRPGLARGLPTLAAPSAPRRQADPGPSTQQAPADASPRYARPEYADSPDSTDNPEGTHSPQNTAAPGQPFGAHSTVGGAAAVSPSGMAPVDASATTYEPSDDMSRVPRGSVEAVSLPAVPDFDPQPIHRADVQAAARPALPDYRPAETSVHFEGNGLPEGRLAAARTYSVVDSTETVEFGTTSQPTPTAEVDVETPVQLLRHDELDGADVAEETIAASAVDFVAEPAPTRSSVPVEAGQLPAADFGEDTQMSQPFFDIEDVDTELLEDHDTAEPGVSVQPDVAAQPDHLAQPDGAAHTDSVDRSGTADPSGNAGPAVATNVEALPSGAEVAPGFGDTEPRLPDFDAGPPVAADPMQPQPPHAAWDQLAPPSGPQPQSELVDHSALSSELKSAEPAGDVAVTPQEEEASLPEPPATGAPPSASDLLPSPSPIELPTPGPIEPPAAKSGRAAAALTGGDQNLLPQLGAVAPDLSSTTLPTPAPPQVGEEPAPLLPPAELVAPGQAVQPVRPQQATEPASPADVAEAAPLAHIDDAIPAAEITAESTDTSVAPTEIRHDRNLAPEARLEGAESGSAGSETAPESSAAAVSLPSPDMHLPVSSADLANPVDPANLLEPANPVMPTSPIGPRASGPVETDLSVTDSDHAVELTREDDRSESSLTDFAPPTESTSVELAAPAVLQPGNVPKAPDSPELTTPPASLPAAATFGDDSDVSPLAAPSSDHHGAASDIAAGSEPDTLLPESSPAALGPQSLPDADEHAVDERTTAADSASYPPAPDRRARVRNTPAPDSRRRNRHQRPDESVSMAQQESASAETRQGSDIPVAPMVAAAPVASVTADSTAPSMQPASPVPAPAQPQRPGPASKHGDVIAPAQPLPPKPPTPPFSAQPAPVRRSAAVQPVRMPSTAQAAPRVPAGQVVVELHAVKVRYGKVKVLEQASLRAITGQSLAVIGPTNAGKSTLIGCCAGEVNIAGGKLYVDGTLVRSDARAALSRAGVVRMQVQHDINLDATVSQYLAANRNAVSVGDAIADLVFERFPHLKPHASRTMRQLTLVDHRILDLAATLTQDPRIVVADDIAEGLDRAGVATLAAICREVTSIGPGLVLSNREPHAALDICSRVAVVQDRRTVKHGASEEIRGILVAKGIHPPS